MQVSGHHSPTLLDRAQCVLKAGALGVVKGCAVGLMGRMNVAQATLLYSASSMIEAVMGEMLRGCFGRNIALIGGPIASLIISTATILAFRKFAGMGDKATVISGLITAFLFVTDMRTAFELKKRMEIEDFRRPFMRPVRGS